MSKQKRKYLEQLTAEHYCNGQTQQQISRELRISQSTVSRILKKETSTPIKNIPLEKIRKLVMFVDNLENSFLKTKQKSPIIFRLKNKKIESRTRGVLPQGMRHLVFKIGSYRCKQCGVTAQETTLHIDHIIPFSRGGTDEIENLQVLCKQCNFDKSDLVLRIDP